MRILITGDRAWDEPKLVERLISRLPEGSVVIVGDCPTGADAQALRYAKARDDITIDGPHKANWKEYGRAAGPIRNREMVRLEPDLCAAFHHDLTKSKGTADCVRQAEKANVPVLLARSYKVINREFCNKCGSRNLVWEAWGSYLDKDLVCAKCGNCVDIWDC